MSFRQVLTCRRVEQTSISQVKIQGALRAYKYSERLRRSDTIHFNQITVGLCTSKSDWIRPIRSWSDHDRVKSAVITLFTDYAADYFDYI